MTNEEKYLKDEKYIFDIAKGIAEAICYDDMEHSKELTEKEIRNWFTSNIKPTLTEDERVILRNMEDVTHIKRDNGIKYIDKDEYIKTYYELPYSHLFQFIKERRRIRDSRTFERRIEIMEDEFYVLVDLDKHEYLQISGETTKHITGALKFADKRTVLEELKTLDNPENFVCCKARASYWLERELLKDEL